MTRLIWSPRSIRDLESIRERIAQDSPLYAGLVVQRLVRAPERLLDFPHSGRAVPERDQPTPHQSGESEREQGIGKDGSRWIRGAAIEFAWGWLRFQPQSALSQWYRRRFGHGSTRLRKIGIVALARKLLVALWRFLETGVIPEGALLKTDLRLR